MMSAYEPFAGAFAAGLVGVPGGVGPTFWELGVASIFGLGTAVVFGGGCLGAWRAGAAGRRTTLLVNPGVGFGLMCFSVCFVAPSSAFRFSPLSGEAVVAGRPGRGPGLPSAAGRCETVPGVRAEGFGGAGGLPLPIESTISPRKLMLRIESSSDVVEEW